MIATMESIKEPPAVFQGLSAFLGEYAQEMADRVGDGLKPLYDPQTEPLSAELLEICAGSITPYPVQASVIEAVLRGFKIRKAQWIIGEMGTGKTLLALWTFKAMTQRSGRPKRMVLTVPNQLIYKWARHAEVVIPDAEVRVVKNWRDLSELIENATLADDEVRHDDGGVSSRKIATQPEMLKSEVWVIPRDKGKLGYSWRSGMVRKKKYVMVTDDDGVRYPRVASKHYHCPSCGARIDAPDGAAEYDDLVKPNGKLKDRWECGECGDQLWQAFNGARSEFDNTNLPVPGLSPRRVSPCARLKQAGIKIDLYAADEIHELKGGDTLQGQMFADLCSISRNILMLTGTLTGGYAENLYYLLWRSQPDRMAEIGFTYDSAGRDLFIKNFGVLQTRRRYTSDNGSSDHLTMGRAKKKSGYTKSLPGISPTLFTNFLLDSAVFIRLSEMHSHLPEFHERVHEIPMDIEQDLALLEMQQQWDDHRAANKRGRAWSGVRAAFLRWPDKPYVEEYTIYDRDENDTLIPAVVVPSLPKKEYPKDRRIRRLITRNKIRGRKTWLFTELTGRENVPAWDAMDDYAEYLEGHGIRAAVLRSQGDGGPKPEDREDWIKENSPGVDVIISNPALVQTGLDLFDFPSIIFAFCGDNTYRLRQASRRAWRLGQKRACEVDYLVYSEGQAKSVQTVALSLMAQKMASSLALEGDFSEEGLAAMGEGVDIGTQLARYIDGQLDDIEGVSTSFNKYREQLMASMPDLGTDIETDHEPIVGRESRRDKLKDKVKADAPDAVAALESLGIDIGEMITDVAEPQGLKNRRELRLTAMMLAAGLKSSPDESIGDRHRFGDKWYHLVCKDRSTVRHRDFVRTTELCGAGATIVFVEPHGSQGPSVSSSEIIVEDIRYIVSGVVVERFGHDQPSRLVEA